MSFYVMRHPGIAVPGIVADSVLEMHLANGWVRVSDAFDDPGEVDLTEFADAVDLDNPIDDEGEPDAAPTKRPAKKAKESTEESA